MKLAILLLILQLKGTLSKSQPRPQIMTRAQIYKVEEGASVQMECIVHNLGENVLLWKQGTRVLSAGSLIVRRDRRISLVGSSLRITEVEREDAGEYACEVESSKEVPTSILHTLDVLHPPSVRPQPESGEVLVKEGSTVTLFCEGVGNPTPSVTWYRNHDELLHHGESLVLSTVTRFTAGVYICRAENGIGAPARAAISVTVLFPPVLETEVSRVMGGMDRKVELACRVYGNPEPTVTWYKNLKEKIQAEPGLRVMRSNFTEQKLTLYNMRKSDFGEYSCEGVNALGTGRAYIQLSGKPESPVVDPEIRGVDTGEYKVCWAVRSYSPLIDHTILYRKAKMMNETGWSVVKIKAERMTSDIARASFNLHSLASNTQYEVQVESSNLYGVSELSRPVIFSTSYSGKEVDKNFFGKISLFRASCSEDVAYSVLLLVLTCGAII